MNKAPYKAIEVESAYLQTNLSWPTVPNADSKTLHANKISGLKMFYYPTLQIMELQAKGKRTTVPITNFVNWVSKEQLQDQE